MGGGRIIIGKMCAWLTKSIKSCFKVVGTYHLIFISTWHLLQQFLKKKTVLIDRWTTKRSYKDFVLRYETLKMRSFQNCSTFVYTMTHSLNVSVRWGLEKTICIGLNCLVLHWPISSHLHYINLPIFLVPSFTFHKMYFVFKSYFVLLFKTSIFLFAFPY